MAGLPTRRTVAIAPAALAFGMSAHAQTFRPFFHDKDVLPKEFWFDLKSGSTFTQEYLPASHLIAKPPASLTVEFQITEPRRDPAFPQYPASVTLWLVSADEAWAARIQIADDPMAQTMMMQVKSMDRNAGGSKSLLVDVTDLKKGAVNTVSLSVGKDGAVKVRAPNKEGVFQLSFTPARFGAGAMSAKGWMRFPDSQLIS